MYFYNSRSIFFIKYFFPQKLFLEIVWLELQAIQMYIHSYIHVHIHTLQYILPYVHMSQFYKYGQTLIQMRKSLYLIVKGKQVWSHETSYISVVLYLVLHCHIRIPCISILYLFTHYAHNLLLATQVKGVRLQCYKCS